MTHSQHITSAETTTAFLDIWKWAKELEQLYTRIAPHFVHLNLVCEHCSPCKGCSVLSNGKMAGVWLSTPEKVALMECNDYWLAESGMLT